MRTILVVGGSSKIGTSIVESFLDNGDNVIATYNKNHIAARTNLATLFFDSNNCNAIISYIKKEMKLLDIVIFLNGILPGKSLIDYKDEEIEEVMAVNFIVQAKLLKYLLPYFKEDSQVIMMSSISGQRGSFDPIYAASKAAILGFVKALSSSLTPKIRINVIAPGLIENSTMYEQMSTERQDFHRANIPLKSFLKSDNLAKVIIDLTMPHWSHLNGACIDLNGGQYVR